MNRLLIALLFCVCSFAQHDTSEYSERHRPQFHFSPPSHWAGGHSGLVFHNGKYHIFYQAENGSGLHWNHAVSTDLIRWQHLPVSVHPDKKRRIYSGCMVVDKDNTAGYGNDAMVAIHTYRNGEASENTEGIALAYSLDEGKTWKKVKMNPAFLDGKNLHGPKVFWSEKAKRWTMIMADDDRVTFLSSQNLREWRFESNFRPKSDEETGMWNSPDLFPMKFGPEEKWVLVVSRDSNTPNAGTRYFVGQFDGKTFYSETAGKYVDYGPDFRDAVTFSSADRKFLLGRMDCNHADDRHCSAALPRELTLERDDRGWFLRQSLVPGFEPNEKPRVFFLALSLPYQNQYVRPQSMIKINMAKPAQDFTIRLSSKLGDEFSVFLKNGEMYIDRSKSGNADPDRQFADTPRKMPVPEPVTDVKILIDHGAIEILANNGKYAMTGRSFPNQDYSLFRMEGDAKLEEWFVYDIGSIGQR